MLTAVYYVDSSPKGAHSLVAMFCIVDCYM